MRSSILIALAGALLGLGQTQLPPPFATPSSGNPPRVVAKPDGARLQLPKGFQASVFAEGFDVPRYMILGPGQEILLADSASSGKVIALKGSQRKTVLSGLDHPYGMALWNGYLYVAETTSVKRYRYDSAALKAGQPEPILSMPEASGGHWTRVIRFDRPGKKFYLGVGSRSNNSAGEPELRAAISRFNPDGSGREIFVSGTRNPTDLLWYPGTDTLWAAVQERDRLGDDLVPDYFTPVRQGEFYGWPYAYIGPNEDPAHKGAQPDLVKKTATPDVLLGAHVAVLGAVFYTGKQFPAEYRGGAFLAYHGSWNRSQRVGYSVVFVPFRDGKPAGKPRDFLTGWMLAPDRKEVWGRPVGLLEMPDGSLLVSEDGANKIWRVSYAP